MGDISEESSAPAPVAKPNEESEMEVLPGLRIKADGTVVRNFDRTLPTTDPRVSHSPVFVANVASKDVVFDSETGIWGRVFLPESVTGGLTKKLPLVVYFHSGGFCIGNAVQVSSKRRRRRRRRCMADEQRGLCEGVCHGASAGGNIAHHMVVSKPVEELYPLTIDGVILVAPFFSAEELSESEKLFSEDETLPLWMNRTFWKFALPEGANRDHLFCNPVSADAARQLAAVKVLPRMLFIVAGKGPLYRRQLQHYHALKQANQDVLLVEVPDGTHVFRKVAALEAENVRVDKVIFDFIH